MDAQRPAATVTLLSTAVVPCIRPGSACNERRPSDSHAQLGKSHSGSLFRGEVGSRKAEPSRPFVDRLLGGSMRRDPKAACIQQIGGTAAE